MYFGHSLPLDVIRHKHSLYNQFYVHHSAPYNSMLLYGTICGTAWPNFRPCLHHIECQHRSNVRIGHHQKMGLETRGHFRTSLGWFNPRGDLSSLPQILDTFLFSLSLRANTTIDRPYHSESIPLQDSHVLVSGSGPKGAPYVQEYRIDVFIPPYLLGNTTQPSSAVDNNKTGYG